MVRVSSCGACVLPCSCNEKALKKSLCTVTRKVGGEVIQSYLDVKSAIVRRDTLAKTIYSKLFDW